MLQLGRCLLTRVLLHLLEVAYLLLQLLHLELYAQLLLCTERRSNILVHRLGLLRVSLQDLLQDQELALSLLLVHLELLSNQEKASWVAIGQRRALLIKLELERVHGARRLLE